MLHNEEEDYKITFSCHRVLSVTLEGFTVVLVFMPHGTNPITGFPGDENLAWGEIRINGEESQNVQFLQNQIQNLYINNQIPRVRCPTCQGMKVLKTLEHAEGNRRTKTVSEEDLICQDCLSGTIEYYSTLKTQIENLFKSNQISQNRDNLLQLIDGGTTLTENLDDEPFLMEFLLLKILILQTSGNETDLSQANELFEEVKMFAESWDLQKIKEKLALLRGSDNQLEEKSVLEKQQSSQIESESLKPQSHLEEEADIEKVHPIDTKIETEPLSMIKLKPVTLPKLNTSLKDIVVDEEEQSPQDEIPTVIKEISNSGSPQEDFHTLLSPPVPEEKSDIPPEEIAKSAEIPMDDKAPALGEALDPISSPDNFHIPLPPPVPEEISSVPPLEFINPADIPLDEDALALGEALDFTPPQETLYIPSPPPLPDKKPAAPTLEFTNPNDIPLDEDAVALGDALHFEPDSSDLQIANTQLENQDSGSPTPFDSISPIVKRAVEVSEEIPLNPLKVLDQKPSAKFEAGYKELNKGKFFFGIDMATTANPPSSGEQKEKTEIFSIFGGKQPNQSPKKAKNPEESTESVPINDIAPITKKLSPLSVRRAARKKRGKKVDICPMCGKIAPQCTCGYMKAKNKT